MDQATVSPAVKHPSFDKDGYPTEETQLEIARWHYSDLDGWLDYIREAWNHDYGRIWVEAGMLRLATGGWSGNESIIRAMREHFILWHSVWESSHRGGLTVLKIPGARWS